MCRLQLPFVKCVCWPEGPDLYTLTRGRCSSSSLMTPHLLKCCATSISVASGGSPVTYTLVFCFNSNHVSCEGTAQVRGCHNLH